VHILRRAGRLLAESPIMILLETDRLLMREERLEDANAYFVYRSKESYWRHIPIEPPTPAEILAQIEKFLPQQAAADRRLYFWAVEEKGSGNVIGEASLMRLPCRNARYGFSLSETRWGQGYGTEIARRILEFALLTLQLHRVEAQVAPSNVASLRIMEKLG